MNINFHIHYKTVFGEQIAVEWVDADLQNKILLMRTYDGEHWSGTLQYSLSQLAYKYVVLSDNNTIKSEWGGDRLLSLTTCENIFLEDQWRSRDTIDNSFLSSAFTEAIFKRDKPDSPHKEMSKQTITFAMESGKIPSHLTFGVVGNIPELGEWKRAIIMKDTQFPIFEVDVALDRTNVFVEYKFVIVNLQDNNIIMWEEGQNKSYHFFVDSEKSNHIRLSFNKFTHQSYYWKGAGVAIPVFSLRSQKSMGIGEFSDILPLVDWSAHLGLKIIQILPVNDTLATKTWQDSYPYAAISVFALHPLYVNIEKIGKFKFKKDQTEYEKYRKQLNELEVIDFESVLESKFKFFNTLFDEEYGTFLQDESVQYFIQNNKWWLMPYAAFCCLRDQYGTSDFNQWPDNFSIYEKDKIEAFYESSLAIKKACDFYIFIQYHADKQLIEARDYARSKGIALKGDLPIGIFRHSSDAWVAPELYNMREQAGAPPDDFAVLGQNWGFPTYNWEAMSKDNFEWWRQRMQQLNRYFDALRIDHILGFFRIWQVPLHHVQGTLGLFNPRLPYTLEDLSQWGLSGDLSRFTMPYITPEIVRRFFGEDAEIVMSTFFEIDTLGRIVFKKDFTHQKQIEDYVASNPQFENAKNYLFQLLTEVLLIEESVGEQRMFNPRITLNTTESFRHLDNTSQSIIMRLYNEYYFNRHEEYWQAQAYWKLPAIIDASDMLICAEDLGMIPKSVPQVLKDLNVLTLEIQRMPKGHSKFGQVREYPYFSVCSPSCHDMSTIRGWWEGDHENAKNYFYNYLHWQGIVPMACESSIVETIINDHVASPSMLAIFPIQDLLGMDDTLRKGDASSEQINEPSNPKHYWRYRFHMPIEKLLEAEALNTKIFNLVRRNGR